MFPVCSCCYIECSAQAFLKTAQENVKLWARLRYAGFNTIETERVYHKQGIALGVGVVLCELGLIW